MSDVNANISVSIDTSNALGQLKALQRQISTFHTSIAKSSQTASAAQADLQKNFLNAVNGIGAFSAELRTVKTSSENFTSSLEKNKFSMREYFRYSGAATRTFGRLFKSEFETINKVATENVKNLQTQYIKMGRDANGAMKAISVRPLTLDMQNLSTQTQIAAQKQALFNQLVKQGSTNLLNFGKNTQWAGRQLMVGFTLPLMALGTAASKTFMDMEAQALKFKKVYGDLFTAPEETQAALDSITELGQAFTKYGIAVSQTVGLAAEAAAAGFKGVDLQRQTTAATRLSVLGQIEQQQALETTISLQNAMGISSEELAQSIDFLNAVENQTVTSLDDITIAIPKVAPVIKSLGGDVKDLAFLMTAMKEGGINASEGANALKSGLASMINPSKKARGMLEGFGISIDKIVDGNAGNLKATVIEFSNAINSLKPLDRARVIEQMFGKFQFARLSTLFQNVTKDGTQAARVLDLAGASVQELSALSEKELGMSADSAMNKFKKSVEDLKFALVPVGKVFLEVVAPFIEKISEIIQKFNGLSDSTKKIITLVTIGFGAIAPVLLMTVGLLANFVANGVKGLMILRNGYLRLTGQSQILGEQTQYLTVEQQQALAAAHSLEQSHARLTQTFTVESTALGQLKNAYIAATTAANNFAMKNPGMMVAPVVPTKRATGKPAVVGGTGNRDTELALLTPGETVIPADMSNKYGSLINGMIADNIPGYGTGKGSIAEEFISTRPGRNASGGEKSQVNVPGGYQLGHFAPAIQMTGAQLRELALEESAKFQAAVESMIDSVGGDLDRLFDVFTNEVTVQSQAFNQALGEVGSNNEAPVQMFRNEAVTQAGAYNAPLIAKMKQAGASTESIENAVEQLAREFEQGITDLGTVTTVTAEDVNRITEEAYRKVADANQDVAAARQELSRPGALKEILGVTPGRTPFSGGYNTKTQREKVNKVVQEQSPGLYPTQQAFNFTGEAARKVGVQNAVAIRQIFDQLNQEAKSRVIGLLGDIDAMSQQVILEAQNAGIDLGKYAIRGITEGIEGQSPSRAARREGQKVVDGFEQGILEGMDDASLAGSRVGNAATDSLATPGVITRAMGKGRGASRPQGPVPIGPVIPTGASLLPIIAAPIVQATEGLEKSIGVSASKLNSLNKGLNSVSFGLTAAAGAGTMFGGKIGEVSQQIFKYSGLMFGLMQITQLLTQAQVARLIAERAATAGILTRTVSDATGAVTFTRVTGLFAGGIKKFIPNLFKLAQKITQMLGPWGKLISIVIAGVFAFNKLKDIADAQREKINGLGDAAFIAGDRLKTLADIFGVVPQKFAFESLPKTVGVGMTGQERTAVDKIRESEDFQKNFGKNIAAIRGATDQQAELLFRGLVVQLKGRGFAEDQVQAIVNAIKLESGKTDVEIDFASISILTPEGRKAVQKDIISLVKLAKTTREIKALSGTLAGIIGATQLAFSNGAISAQEYADQMSFINLQIASMPYPAGIEATNALFNSMDSSGVLAKTAAGITNIKDRLLVLNAIALAGLGPDSPLIKGLASTDLLMQDISRRQINKLIDTSIISTSKAAAAALEKIKTATTDGGKGLSDLSKKVIEGLKKELKLLEDKKKALEDVNNEIERQQEFQQKQQQLDADMVQAKISGNYIQAALLGQQKLYNKSQYDRETSELELDRQIQKLQDRIDALENGAKVTSLDKKLANIENKVSAASKSSGKADPAKGSGSTGKDDSAKNPPKIDYGPDPKVKVLTVKQLAEQAQKLRSNIVSDGYRNYHHFAFSGKDYFVSQRPSRNFVEGKFNPNGGIIITGQPQKFSVGGKVQAFEPGGKVSGPGTSTSDSIPAYLSDGEYVFSAKAVDNAGGPGIVEGWHNALRRADGGPVWKKPKSSYNSKNQPTGNPIGRYWGELERLYQQSPLGFDKNGKPIFNNAGKDPWGGTEIPGLPFNGKVANFSDYWHQLAEQPRKSSGPGMGLDKSPDRYAGSGASMGGIGNGAYGAAGFQMFAKGGRAENKNGNFFSRFNPVNAISSMFSGMFNVGASKAFNTSTNIKSQVNQKQKDYMALQTAQILTGYTSAFNLKNKTSPEIFGSKKLGTAADILGVLPGLGVAGKLGMSAKKAVVPKTTAYAQQPMSGAKAFGPDDAIPISRYVERPTSANNRGVSTVLHKGVFGEDAGTFFRALSDHDMASIAGYVRVPNPNRAKFDDAYRAQFPDVPQIVDRTVEAGWSSLARRWKPEASEIFPRGVTGPADYSEAALPYLNLDPALPIGGSWIPDTVKSITRELDFAKEIAARGGTSGGQNGAIARIIVDPMVQGLADFRNLLPGHNASAANPGYTEGAIAPFTRYILEGIKKNAYGYTDTEKNVTHLIDEYIFRAVQTSPYAQFLGRDLAIRSGKQSWDKLLPIVKKANGGLVSKFADGGPVGKNKFNIGKPDPKQSLLNNFLFGQKYVGGNSNISKGEVPFGPGGISKIIAKLGYKPVNLFNQYMNYFKAKKMLKGGVYHGSADLGRNSDGPFSGITELSGDYARDPYHGMGFFGTTSKSEADLYAGGYNVPGQWGESYGSLNKITKLPFGRYLDFTKDLKNQNYGMWKMFEAQRDKGFMGAHEKLGSIMNDAGMTGAIMPRISAGMAPDEINFAKWIALNKPEGTVLEELGSGFANGGLVKNKVSRPTYSLPSFDTGISYLPKDMIAQLHEGERVLTKEENKNFSSGGPITNNIIINGTDLNKKEIAQEVMIELDRVQKKNNKTNLVSK
jgi:TP901 family phage tail tape measure protein